MVSQEQSGKEGVDESYEIVGSMEQGTGCESESHMSTYWPPSLGQGIHSYEEYQLYGG